MTETTEDNAWIAETHEPGLVSVVIPVHNREALIRDTLDSVHAQNYRPIEVIIVDDGSTDASMHVIEQWRQMNTVRPEFTVNTVRQRQSGAQAARNRGIARSRGEFVHLFDSDDVMHADKLKKQVSTLQKDPDIGFCVCDIAFFKTKIADTLPVVRFSERNHHPKDHIERVVLNIGSTLYRRRTIAALGPLCEDLDASQDFEFNFRLFAHRIKGVWIPEVLAYIRNHADSISGERLRKHHRHCFQSCLKVEARARQQGLCSREILNAIGNRIVFYIALHLVRQGKVKLAYAYYFKAFRLMTPKSRLRGLCHLILRR